MLTFRHSFCDNEVERDDVIELPDERVIKVKCPDCGEQAGYIHIEGEPLSVRTSGDLTV